MIVPTRERTIREHDRRTRRPPRPTFKRREFCSRQEDRKVVVAGVWTSMLTYRCRDRVTIGDSVRVVSGKLKGRTGTIVSLESDYYGYLEEVARA